MKKPASTGKTKMGMASYKKGGMISEYGGKEKYASKAAMKKHEGSEGKKMEMKEKMGSYKKGGMVKGGKGC
jgi:hypothetical protein